MTGNIHNSLDTADRLSASPRLFESDLLDRMSRVHFLTPVAIYVPLILALGGYSLTLMSPTTVLAWALLGLAGWSLTEYFGHRFLFHATLDLPFGLGPRVHFLIHGVHHDHPNDPLRLVMPPLLSGTIMLIAFGVITLLFGTTWCFPILGGFMVGYLAYDCTHFWLHNATPKTRLGRHLRRIHMRHHFHDDTKGYGVLSFWWDHVFGTAERLAESRQAVVRQSAERPKVDMDVV